VSVAHVGPDAFAAQAVSAALAAAVAARVAEARSVTVSVPVVAVLADVAPVNPLPNVESTTPLRATSPGTAGVATVTLTVVPSTSPDELIGDADVIVGAPGTAAGVALTAVVAAEFASGNTVVVTTENVYF